MLLFRRSAAVAGVLLSILGLLTCLAGTAVTWMAKTRAQSAAAAVFTATDTALAFIGARLERVKGRVLAIGPRVTTLSEWAERLQSIEPGPDLKAAVDAMRERLDALAGELKEAEGGLEPIESVARAVQSLATSMQAVTVADLAGDTARAASRLEALRARLLEIRENRLVAREFAIACIAEAADLDTRLANAARKIDDVSARVSSARASSADRGRRVHAWIALGAVLLIAALVWFGASQVCMLQRARQAWRGL
jgi:hypothetical protein